MDFSLNEDLEAMRELAREFTEEKISPYADQWDKDHHFPVEVMHQMGELGFFGCTLPEEYGGTDTGFQAMTILCEEVARGSSSLRVAFNTQCLGTALSINRHGTDEQKKQWIPDLISSRKLGCFAISEPNAGSDTMSMETTARPDGDGYVLNGSKTWISLAPVADFALVYAYHDKSIGSKGLSAFLVDMHSDGISTRELEKLGTLHFPTGEIAFEDVRIPGDALLGKLGDGVKILFSSLNQTRISCAAGGVGLSQACLDTASKYCTERKQFGQPIGKFQMNQELIAVMAAETEAARLLTYRAAWQKDQGTLGNVLDEYPVARFYRDAVVYQIVEGTVNIQKMIIAQDQLGFRKANR